MSLNYANYNFTSIVSQLQSILVAKEGVWDSYESSTATTLIELFAYIGEMLMYTAERRAQESFLETAQLKSSVINIVRLVNYQPARIISSNGSLTFTIASPIANNIYIPKYTSATRSDGTQFMTATDGVLFAGSTSVTINGIQGVLIPFSFISDGTENQEYTISDTDIENNNLTVLNGTWTLVSSFVESQSSSQVYREYLNNDETVTLVFGDNKFGMIPLQNSVVSGNYIQSVGSAGNVYSIGVITTLQNAILDDQGNPVTVTVSNSTLFLGGADAEDIESVRYNAPRIFATAERDVTKQDYISDLENYPSIAAINVWGENEENPPNIEMLNQIRIVMLLGGWNLAGTSFKQQISNYLQTRAQLTVQYQFLDPYIPQLVVNINAVTSQSNSLATIETNIVSALNAEFSLGNVDIGVPIRYSDVVESVEGVTGVLYSFTQLVLQQIIGTGNNVQLTFPATLLMTRIKDASLQIYNNGVLAGFSGTADGTVSDIDQSSNGLVTTFNGVFISTKYYKFGTGSAKFNGLNSYISTPTHVALNLSSGVWTADFQVYPDVLQPGTLWFQSNDVNNYFRIYTKGNGAVGMMLVAAGVTVMQLETPAGQIIVGQWTHLEFSQNGTTYDIFVNGSPIVTTVNVNLPALYLGQAEIGRDGSLGHYFSGYMDEVMISKGVQRNNVNFSAPTSAYAPDSFTSLLLHLNGFGRLIAVAGSGISGTIDYTYGLVNVVFQLPPANLNPIMITYQQAENNLDLIPTKQQIVQLVGTNVTVTYPS